MFGFLFAVLPVGGLALTLPGHGTSRVTGSFGPVFPHSGEQARLFPITVEHFVNLAARQDVLKVFIRP